jgi:hypothetical protein
MRTIHKYVLPLQSQAVIMLLSPHHQVVHVAEQHHELTVWIEIYKDEPRVKKRFYVVATGGAVPENATHRGTALMSDGLVWHVYEEP